MGLSHFAVHEIERKIAEVVYSGFSPKLDKADALQIGHDVADMILGEYRIDTHPYAGGDRPSYAGSRAEDIVMNALDKLETAKGRMTLAAALNSLASGLEKVRDGLRLCAGQTGEEKL